MTLIELIEFTLDNAQPLQRGAYRAKVRGLQVRIEDDNALYDVYDISAMGCSIIAPQSAYEVGRILDISLEVKKVPIIPDLRARVVRHISQNLMACCFLESSLTQEYALDKLVLEIQKKHIARYKASPLLKVRS